jgi:hypothetical protein
MYNVGCARDVEIEKLGKKTKSNYY